MTNIDELLDGLGNAELRERLAFVLEIDRLKTINRRTRITDQSRFENSAEHSWHLAVMAWVLVPHAAAQVDVSKVIRLLLLHDIVEVDADDTFLYDTVGRETKAAQEAAAAERLYGLLPASDGAVFHALFDEFEARTTPEAQFAAAVDRLQPLLLNLVGDGRTWNEHGIEPERVYEANQHIESGSEELWELARSLLDRAVGEGVLGRLDAEPFAIDGDLVVRPTTLEDLDRVLEIERMPGHADVIGAWERIRHQERIGSDSSLHLACEIDGAIVGYAILSSVDTPVVSLEHFAVADKRRGYGRRALQSIVDALFAGGVRKVWLDVVAHNTSAIELYESEGFVREGLLAGHDELNGRIVDLVLMARLRDAALQV